MNDFYRGELQWRETYFIFFPQANRPTLTQVERVLGELNPKFVLQQLTADDDGLFESVMVLSTDDNAAVEISLELGEAVVEQRTELAQHLRREATPRQLATIAAADARLDVMHFEHVSDVHGDDNLNVGDDELDEMLDPGSLLLVVEALVKLTRGVPIDPATGAIMV